jgi:GT2 family glycosyltransferase
MTIAVLITYFNEGGMLTDCLESLRDQSVLPDEVLIYDDCSLVPAATFVPDDFPVTVIRGQVNCGPSVGRNELLSRCETDYIHFHDADDVFRPTWCERVRDAIRRTGADVVLTDIAVWQAPSTPSLKPFYQFGARQDAEDFASVSIRTALVPSVGTYRRTAVEAIGGYDSTKRFSEDYDFHVRLAISGVTHAIVDEALIFQRVHAGNRSNQKLDFWLGEITILQDALAKAQMNHRPHIAAAAAALGARLFAIGDVDAARTAFLLCEAAGCRAFDDKPWVYRMAAQNWGGLAAERMSSFYRDYIPRPVRRLIATLR